MRRIETAYDSAGRPYLFTSYNAASGGSIVNQVKRYFNGYGQTTTEFQSHSGAVVDASTPKVQYAYSTSAPGSGQNYSRPTSTTYPNGRVLGYSYSGLDAAVSRVSAITEGTGGSAPVLESYQYLGMGTVVERVQPGGRTKLTSIRQAGDAAASSDGGDRYSGLDRFGRVIDQNWVRTSASAGGSPAGSSTVRLQYGYDRVGNATHRRDLVNTALSELYEYDQLDRLTSMKRGVLSAANTITSPTYQQSWTLDARGNQTQVTTNGSTVNRQFNEANETTSVSGGTAPTYDAAGNTTALDGRTYVYDAWNRLKQVKSGSTTLASYAYDGLRRRVVETSGGTTTAVYFSGAAAVEERIGTFGYHNVIGATGQTVFRDVFSDVTIPGGANPDWRTYAQQNANGDVVALIGHGTAAGNVVERYAYAPYGAVSILDAAGAPVGSSPYQWRQLFQGGRFDATTGLYVFGFRDYDPSTGVWRQRDPIGLAGGDMNLYRFTGNNPIVRIDPSGLDWLDSYFPGYGWSNRLFNDYQRNGAATDPIPGAATGPQPIAPLSPEDPGVFTSNSIQPRGPESQKVSSTTAGRNAVETLKALAAKGVVDGAMEVGASGVGKFGRKALGDVLGPCPVGVVRPRLSPKARDLLDGKNVTVKSIKEADALLKEALPNARKVKGTGPGQSGPPDWTKFKGKDPNGIYHKDYHFDPQTKRIYGHGPKNPHADFKHINVKLPDGTKVTIAIEPK